MEKMHIPFTPLRKLVKICLADFFVKGEEGTLHIHHMVSDKKIRKGGRGEPKFLSTN